VLHETPAKDAVQPLPTILLRRSASDQPAEGRPAERTLFGHPIGLANLFGVELWERFSFYGMLTILCCYLYYSVTDGGLELPKATATGIVGAYGGLVCLSTVLRAGSTIGCSAWNAPCSTAAWWLCASTSHPRSCRVWPVSQ
jgi:hypothetical protein